MTLTEELLSQITFVIDGRTIVLEFKALGRLSFKRAVGLRLRLGCFLESTGKDIN